MGIAALQGFVCREESQVRKLITPNDDFYSLDVLEPHPPSFVNNDHAEFVEHLCFLF